MKIVHVPFSFHPDPIGGTEVYVEALARQQREDGMTAIVAAPGRRADMYEHRGLTVFRFPVTEDVRDIRELYGEGDAEAAASFARILDDETPDVVHLHAFTRGASLRLVQEAKRRGIPVIFSYHTPTVSCQRGTLLKWGKVPCDGRLDVRACSQCSLHGLGLNRACSTAAGWIPAGLGRAIGAASVSGAAWTALRTTELVTLRHEAFRRLMFDVDHVVALCDWVKNLLLRNGVPGDKITVSRQGLWAASQPSEAVARPSGELPVRIMFLGRLDPTKGAHLLIEAMRSAPDLQVMLDIYGVVQHESNRKYLDRLKQMAAGDIRIRFHDAIPADKVVSQMQGYDVLAAPSQCFETGPLVVMEAFGARLPVIGSDLGGISELVKDGIDGILVPSGSVAQWTEVLYKVAAEPGVLKTLRDGIRPPRGVQDCARELGTVYRDVAGVRACA